MGFNLRAGDDEYVFHGEGDRYYFDNKHGHLVTVRGDTRERRIWSANAWDYIEDVEENPTVHVY